MDVPSGIVNLFGSEARAKVLSALANARGGLSGYRISQLSGVQPIKVSRELRRLANAGLVASSPLREGRAQWRLVDEDLRALLVRRVRLSWSEDWLSNDPLRGTEGAELRRRLEGLPRPELSRYSWKAGPPKLMKEFERDPAKDAILRRLRLPPSRRERLSRRVPRSKR